MFELNVTTDFSAAHQIRGHRGKCAQLHGHNFKVEVRVEGEELDELGMLIDFFELKARLNAVLEEMDHRCLNDLPAFARANPTAEVIARVIAERLGAELPGGVAVAAVTVHETERAAATYRPGRGAGGAPSRSAP